MAAAANLLGQVSGISAKGLGVVSVDRQPPNEFRRCETCQLEENDVIDRAASPSAVHVHPEPDVAVWADQFAALNHACVRLGAENPDPTHCLSRKLDIADRQRPCLAHYKIAG